MLLLWSARPSEAATADTTHNITVVVVNPGLSISDDSGNFELSMEQGDRSAQSATHVVNYQLYGNNLPASALDGVVTAKLSSPMNGLSFEADVGSFTNQGTEGNIDLNEHAAGFQPVGVIPLPLADKTPTSGTQAKVLNGTLPVTWKAVATEDLPAGQHTVLLTVTLKDS